MQPREGHDGGGPDQCWPAGEPGITTREAVVEPGVRVRLVEAGPEGGEPAVLLHGWACSAYSFRFLIPDLAAAGYRVVAPDLIGHGFSDKPSDPARYRTDALVRHAAALVRLGAGDRQPLVVGHSLGAGLALRIALDQPEWFQGLALLNPVGFGPTPIATLARWLSPRSVEPLLPLVVRRWTFGLVLSLVRGRGSRYEERDVDEYWAPTGDPRFLPALRAILHGYDWSMVPADRLATLRPPTLVVLGSSDLLVGRMADDWAGWRALERLGARLIRVPGAGHVVHEERPELVRDAVLRLARATGTTATPPASSSGGR